MPRKRVHVRRYQRRNGPVSEHDRGYEAGSNIPKASAAAEEGAVSMPGEGEEDRMLTNLDQFYGTTQYYNVMGANVTDGVKYVMDNGYSWFVTDAIVAMRMLPELKREEFLVVELKLPGSNKAQMVISDGNENVLYTQDYGYTDAKRELKLYYTNNVVLLPSEY